MNAEHTANKLAIAAATLGLAGMSAPLNGGLMRDMALDPQHRALGQQYLVGASVPLNTGGGAAGAMHIYTPGLGLTAQNSMAIISPEWGLTAWHCIADLIPYGPLEITVSTGANYRTDVGVTVAVDRYIPVPGGAPGDSNLPDLCLVHFAEPIPGVTTAKFGTAAVDEVLTAVGYGRYGSPATGELPRDGNVRAGRGNKLSYPDSFNPYYYDALAVGSGTNIPLAGRTLSGDSGAPIFNAQGEMIGINAQGTLGTGWVGASYYVRLDNPEIAAWITTETGIGTECAVDFNRDGFVDFFDYDEFVACFELSQCGPAQSPDFNHDGFVDFFDYDAFITGFERGC